MDFIYKEDQTSQHSFDIDLKILQVVSDVRVIFCFSVSIMVIVFFKVLEKEHRPVKDSEVSILQILNYIVVNLVAFDIRERVSACFAVLFLLFLNELI